MAKGEGAISVRSQNPVCEGACSGFDVIRLDAFAGASYPDILGDRDDSSPSAECCRRDPSISARCSQQYFSLDKIITQLLKQLKSSGSARQR